MTDTSKQGLVDELIKSAGALRAFGEGKGVHLIPEGCSTMARRCEESATAIRELVNHLIAIEPDVAFSDRAGQNQMLKRHRLLISKYSPQDGGEEE